MKDPDQVAIGELLALREPLSKEAGDDSWGKLPRRLLVLIDDLEESMRLAASCQEICEYTDATNALRDFHWTQTHLASAARSLAAACRAAIHKSVPADRKMAD